RALVTVIREPNPRDSDSIFNPVQMAIGRAGSNVHMLSFDRGTMQRMLWPVGERYESGDNPASLLFPPSPDIDGAVQGFLRFMSMRGPTVTADEPLRFADAVAAAGVGAATGGQRRAVIFILSRKHDSSTHGPREVRRYLAALGVPLFVWSPTETPPEGAEGWGEFDDVSAVGKLSEAVSRVR